MSEPRCKQCDAEERNPSWLIPLEVHEHFQRGSAGGQPPSDGPDEAERLRADELIVQRGVKHALYLLCEKLKRDNQRLSVDCNALRLALRSGLPDCLGCGKPFHTFVDAYRCTHCDAYLHKDCAERHFAKRRPLDELERQIASDAYAATFQTLGQYRSGLLAAIREIRAYRAERGVSAVPPTQENRP